MAEPGLERNFDLPAMGRRLAEFASGKGPLVDIVANKLAGMLMVLEQQVSERTPVGVSGNARGAWGYEPPQMSGTSPPQMTGELRNPLDYVVPLEYGAHWPGGKGHTQPPSAALELWVRRVLEVSAEDAPGVAYVVARSIGRKGLKGVHMLENGWNASQDAFDKLYAEMLVELLIELGPFDE